MTLQEIADSLPNGFHHAQIKTMSIDYLKREVTLEMEVWVADSLEDDSETYQSIELRLAEFLLLIIERPDSRYEYYEPKPLWVEGRSVESHELPNPFPEGVFTYSFFVHDWNASIYLAAKEASMLRL